MIEGGQAGTESTMVPTTLPTTPFQPVTQLIYASGSKFMQGPNQVWRSTFSRINVTNVNSSTT